MVHRGHPLVPRELASVRVGRDGVEMGRCILGSA